MLQLIKMVYSDYLKFHILFLARKGYKAPTITLLEAENLSCTHENVFLSLKRHAATTRKLGSGHLSKVTA